MIEDRGNRELNNAFIVLFARVVQLNADGSALCRRLDFTDRPFVVGAGKASALGLKVGDVIEQAGFTTRRANTSCNTESPGGPRADINRARRGSRGGRGRLEYELR
jgi:hypothetical protein